VNWVSLGTTTLVLTNPRLGIITGASPDGFPNADVAWAEVIAQSIPAAPRLKIGNTSLNFSTIPGVNPANQIVTVSNSASGTLNWNTMVTGAGLNWLSAGPESGTNNGSVTAGVTASGLGLGSYNRQIIFSAAGASNSPQTVNVTLTLSKFELSKLGLNGSGMLSFEVGGASNLSFSVQASTNLLNWSSVPYVLNPDGTVTILGESQTNYLERYYRGVVP
jgi:hypothetical protein